MPCLRMSLFTPLTPVYFSAAACFALLLTGQPPQRLPARAGATLLYPYSPCVCTFP
jgi:hypothetical protein